MCILAWVYVCAPQPYNAHGVYEKMLNPLVHVVQAVVSLDMGAENPTLVL